MCKYELVILFLIVILIRAGCAFTTDISLNSTNPQNSKFSKTIISSATKEDQNEAIIGNAFQQIKHFVYPKVYCCNHTLAKVFASNHRNITTKTIDPAKSYALHLHSNQPLTKYSDFNDIAVDDFGMEEKYNDLENHLTDTTQTNSLFGILPLGNPSLLGGLTNVLLPLVLMGVMTLVTSLVSSVLGLLQNLNVTLSTLRNGQPEQFVEKFDQKNAVNHLLLNNLERILRLSFDMYERKLALQKPQF